MHGADVFHGVCFVRVECVSFSGCLMPVTMLSYILNKNTVRFSKSFRNGLLGEQDIPTVDGILLSWCCFQLFTITVAEKYLILCINCLVIWPLMHMQQKNCKVLSNVENNAILKVDH